MVWGQANSRELNKKLIIDAYTRWQIQRKETNNEQDKVASRFVGYRPSVIDYRHSALAVVIELRIISGVVSEMAGWGS